MTPSRPEERRRQSIPRSVACYLVESIRTLPTMVLNFMQPIVLNQSLHEVMIKPQEHRKERK